MIAELLILPMALLSLQEADGQLADEAKFAEVQKGGAIYAGQSENRSEMDLSAFQSDPAHATTRIVIAADLSAASAFSLPNKTKREKQETVLDASLVCYDSLGEEQLISIEFFSVRPQQFGWRALSKAVSSDREPAGQSFEIGNGSLHFDDRGELLSTSGAPSVLRLPNDGIQQTIGIEIFAHDLAGAKSVDKTSNGRGQSEVTFVAQDGRPEGVLEETSVEDDGKLYGRYSNGAILDLSTTAP